MNPMTAAAELAPHYSRFRVTERVLLTGHSHQAWPDVGFDGQQQAWLDAAEHVDGKWDLAFEKAEAVKAGFARLLGESDTRSYVLAASTHDLLVRFLSALPLQEKPQIVTTDGEFHSMRRQLARLEETGIEIVRVPVTPVATLSERVVNAVTDKTAAIMMSSVMFRDATIVPNLSEVATATQAQNMPFLVDAYHAINVLPFVLSEQGLESAFVVGGGYKYCQLGEGNCFMRVPLDCDMRPIVTGWYAEFDDLEGTSQGLPYPPHAARFNGSTYDPTSHYRAASVFEFFQTQGLTPTVLRAINLHQQQLLREGFEQSGFDQEVIKLPNEGLQNTAGFLSLQTPYAKELQHRLKERQIHTDFRDDHLRFGPAPYVTDQQLMSAIEALNQSVQNL